MMGIFRDKSYHMHIMTGFVRQLKSTFVERDLDRTEPVQALSQANCPKSAGTTPKPNHIDVHIGNN